MPLAATRLPEFSNGLVLAHCVEKSWPILVCLLGEFRVLKTGRPENLRSGKAEALLGYLALQPGRWVPREILLEALWPDSATALAAQSLSSLIHTLRKPLGEAIQGHPPILHKDGAYRLHTEAGIGVDTVCFDHLVNEGNQRLITDGQAAAAFYLQAIHLYQGDLYAGADAKATVERERLRARFLTALAHLGDYYYAHHDYSLALHYARRLLEGDAYREDAHRLVMRCHVRRGERAQALRQYRLCRDLLLAEYDITPEPRTTHLFEQIRLAPDSI
jgi:DNA-binding SARP family transcriptional activator